MEVKETPDPDHLCSICIRLLYEPITLECNHNYCSLCLKHLLRSNPNKACPLCRRDMSDFDQENAVFNEKLQNRIKQSYPRLWVERSREFLEEMAEEKHKIIKKLIVGNDCEPAPSHGNGYQRWTLYLSLEGENDPRETGKYIQKVVVNLHPTFRPPVLEFVKPPFEVMLQQIKRTGMERGSPSEYQFL
eukprot:TRINITY_DN193_c0_g1_i5.p1 TRINITY_DN193_c0_g1~~TRINITY_DN193_c0_g1_i5.p1  ORF type:complete len:189 (+),score=27.38 TRINITY_DN193_c0_g1_i5:91-657(+)